jgi:hypothetical protein
MLEFKEVTYLTTTRVGYTEEIRTPRGHALIDYDKGYCWYPLMTLPGVPVHWHFLKEDSTLYIMREEPCYYA